MLLFRACVKVLTMQALCDSLERRRSVRMPGSGQRWQVLRTSVGFIYPVVKSVQAILSEDMEDDLTWLRYWVVLALVSLIEMAVDPMVDYFPAYLLAKCAFLIWCMAPSPNNGASFVFTQVWARIF